VDPLHQRVLDSAAAAAKSATSRDQIRRYGREFLAWCEGEPAVFTLATALTLRDRYLAHLGARGVFPNEQAQKHRKWTVNRLVDAARMIEARATGPTVPLAARTRLVDELVPNTELDRVVQEMLATAPNPSRRAVLRCDVGLFLSWCCAEDRAPASISVIDLERYRSWIRAHDRKAEPPLVAARRIVTALNPPRVWW
jgi:hypothetical protein